VQVAEHGEAGADPGGQPPAQPDNPAPAEGFVGMVRTDLRPALVLALAAALSGVPLGWIWSRIAPPQRVVVVPDGGLTPLQVESYHRFDDLVLFMLLGLGAGLLIGIMAWLVRSRRGPVMMLGGVLGSVVGAYLATQVGLTLVELYYPLPQAARVRDVFELAPMLESPWVLLAQPLTAALGYGIAAAWNGLDDLGRTPHA
jgi:hypothetical protein